MECHVTVPDTFPDTKSMHDEHVIKDDIKCFKCHGDIKHGKIQMYEVFSPDCQECHGNRHSEQEEIYSGAGGTNVPVVPDPMFLANVTCEGCHSSMGQTNTSTASFGLTDTPLAMRVPAFSSCSTCHGRGFDSLLAMWQSNVKARIQRLEIQRSYNILSAGRADTASVNLNLVRKDGSYGAHNNRYVNLLLDRTEEEMKVADKKPTVDFLYERNSNCLNCHFGIENVSIQVKDQTFPHGAHLFSKRCTDCHVEVQPSSADHGNLRASAQSCTDCHHESKNNKCETCHSLQSDFYAGKFLASSPDTMQVSGISCSDCHLTESAYPTIPSSQVCATCHDDGAVKAYTEEIAKIKVVLSQWGRIFPKMVVYYESNSSKAELGTLRSLEPEIDSLEKEGSMGAHNLGYSKRLIDQAEILIKGFKN